ncbi:MAG TPA: HEXXH motif-containing putative peptide modification protein [Micropepsaceae bacterium]|nr:HEXXH motif-containing putative peptide modification protein [Micropepsaceae bacterium]
MQSRLKESLVYVAEQCDGRVRFSHAGLTEFFDRLAAGAVSPLVFGAYCDLVLAIEANALDEAETLFAEIVAAPNAPLGPVIIDLAADDIVGADRYRRFSDTDVEMPFTLFPPRPQDAARTRALIGDAFAALDASNCALADEIRILLPEIVLASGEFEGISAFMMWGGVILNDNAHNTLLDMVQVLAHESGHHLLFGLCADGPMHENDDEARFSSPLRMDPRPMDGIVHATYVSARMHQAVNRMMDSGLLDEAQMEKGRAANQANVKRFAHGMEAIEGHARLTSLGAEIMGGAQRYMRPHL